MTTYSISTNDSDFRTTDSRKAASVAVSQRRNGRDPSAYAIVDVGEGVSVRRAEIMGTVAATAKSLVAAAK